MDRAGDDRAEPRLDFTRRELLKLMAASFALAGATSCRRPVETIVPYVDPPERVVPGVPRYYATTMPLALGAYGLVVESHEGRPVKIEGNPRHPSTSGGSNLHMQSAILGLYDPDRSQSVRYEGAAKTWDDFVAAWRELEAGHLESQGAGLAVLSESFSSPTLARLKKAFLERFPRARWAAYEAASEENVFDGIASATVTQIGVSGAGLQPVYRFDRARVILSLDADFLGTDTGNVANAQGFAQGRHLDSEHPSMNRLYVAESGYSVTGANADHRVRLSSRGVGEFVVALAAELRQQGLDLERAAPSADGGVPGDHVPGVDAHWMEVLAKDLLAHRGEGIIVAGSVQPPAVHAAVFALNAALGNGNATVTYHGFEDASRPSRQELAALAAAMDGGEISTLVMLGGNPVYTAPVDLEFGAKLAKLKDVATTIHLSPYVDETSALADWHVPETHFLEAWGDARAAGAPASVIQPLILPLFGAHSAVEVLGAMAGEGALPGEEALAGYELVRATWKESLGETGFEAKWNRALHDGLFEGSANSPSEPKPRPQALSEALAALSVPSDADGLEIVFRLSPTVFDGRFANNSWLQELPDAITKMTWDNAAVLSPATAERLGVANEDVVRLAYRERSVEVPVWILPGHSDDSVSVTLGYGRRAAGRVGNGVGADLYALRTSSAPDFDGGLRLEKTGGTHPIAGTQDHSTMVGRDIVQQASLHHYEEHPDFAQHEGGHGGAPKPLFKDPVDWSQGNQWGMTIDLSRCTGCSVCVVACQSENNIAVVGKEQVKNGREMHWLRLDRYFTSSSPDEKLEGGPIGGYPLPENPAMVFQPMPCQHCETAPCEQVCPVAATVHDHEGLNVMVYNRCIGTRYCLNNCPYKVRRFNYFHLTKHLPEVVKLAQNPDVTVRSRGVMEKCSFCLQRISAGKKQAKREGRPVRDGDMQTACQQACPVDAIAFGNINDPGSAVAKNKHDGRNYVVFGETNSRPRVSYLAKVRNPHPDLSGEAAGEAHA